MVITTPKFGNGRLIDLDTETTRRFSDHQQRQDLASRTLGVVNPDRFVFLTLGFNPARPDYLAERFLLISSHLGLPRIRFHDLRHTYATIVLAADVSIHVVSQRLDHLNNSVTLNVYSHVSQACKQTWPNQSPTTSPAPTRTAKSPRQRPSSPATAATGHGTTCFNTADPEVSDQLRTSSLNKRQSSSEYAAVKACC